MKSYWTVATLCTLVLGHPWTVNAQSLADVARQETARRQAIAGAAKVITNGDLKPVPPVTASTPPTSAAGTTLAPPPELDKASPPGTGDQKDAAPDAAKPAVAAALADEKKEESYWRKRMATTRDNLTRTQTLQDAMQTRINALQADYVNRDDPAQRAQIVLQRQKALSELERLKKDTLQYQTELTTIADEARRAGVPAGWVR